MQLRVATLCALFLLYLCSSVGARGVAALKALKLDGTQAAELSGGAKTAGGAGYRFSDASLMESGSKVPASVDAGALLNSWRSEFRRREQGRNRAGKAQPADATLGILLETSSAKSDTDKKIDETYALATDLLRDAYGIDDRLETGEEKSNEEIQAAEARFAVDAGIAPPAADEPAKDSGSPPAAPEEAAAPAPEPQRGAGGKLLSSMLKTGATLAQKYGEYNAAKKAAQPQGDQCVMCIYTLEKMQQLITPADQTRDPSLLGGEVGKQGQFLGSSRGARVPVSFPRASAYKGKKALDPNTRPWAVETAGGFGSDPDLRVHPINQRHPRRLDARGPPNKFQMPSMDTVDPIVDGDQRTPVDDGFRAVPRAQPVAPALAGASMRFREMLDAGMGHLAGQLPAAPFTRADEYPLDRTEHPPMPPLDAFPNAVDGAAAVMGEAVPTDSTHYAPWIGQRDASFWLQGPAEPASFLETQSGRTTAEGAAPQGGMYASFLEMAAETGDVPAHLRGDWYSTPPTVEPTAAQHAEALKLIYEQIGQIHAAMEEQEQVFGDATPEEYMDAWLEAAGHTAGQFRASVFHPDMEVEEEEDVDEEGGGAEESAPEAAFLQTEEGTKQFPYAEAPRIPDAGITTMRTGTPLDGSSAAALSNVAFERTEVVPDIQPSPAGAVQPGPSDVKFPGNDLYRDFAGEDAVFGMHPDNAVQNIGPGIEAGSPVMVKFPVGAVQPGAPGSPAAPVAAPPPPAAPAAKGAPVAAGKGAPAAPVARQEAWAEGGLEQGPWAGGGDVPTHSNGRSGMTTEDVWFGKVGYIAPGDVPDENANMRRVLPQQAPDRAMVAAADIANEALRDPKGVGNKAVERVFSREGLRAGPHYDDALVPEVALKDKGAALGIIPAAPTPVVAVAGATATTGVAGVTSGASSLASGAMKGLPSTSSLSSLGGFPRLADGEQSADGDELEAVLLEEGSARAGEGDAVEAQAGDQDNGSPSLLSKLGGSSGGSGLLSMVKNVASTVMGAKSGTLYPLPHNCADGETLCIQRMRQPSVLDLYRRKRRDEQRAAMNRALLTYSLALDTICERDSEGIDTNEARDIDGKGMRPEEQMAGYPHLNSEKHRRFGYFEDEWSYLNVQTQFGDKVGVGSLHHYHLPE
jgi:hypothetical protein